MMPNPPHIRLLLKLEERIKTVNFLADAGIAAAVTVRHARNRKPVRGERPCISLIFVDDDIRPDDQNRNAWETVRELAVDLQIDLDLDTEDSNLDPTGLSYLSLVVAAALRSLKDPIEPVYLDGMCDNVIAGAIDPEDRSTPDDGRMTRALTVVYRVRSDDPNVLLADGENG